MKKTENHTTQRGFAMLVTVGVVAIVAVASAGVYGLARQEMHATRMTRDYLLSKVIAEAGANQFYNQLKKSFTGFGTYPAVEFGGGEYQVTLTAVGTDRALLRSEGRAGINEAVITVSLRNFGITHTTGGGTVNPNVLKNAMTSGGSMVLGGSVTVNGNIASATSITANGNAAQIKGSASSPSVSAKKGVISGGFVNDPERYNIDWDSFLKLEDYLEFAVTWDGRDVTSYPDGTILYVPGNIKITTSATLRLCIIATGDIWLAGQATLEQPGTYPTLVSRDGSIKLAGGSSVDGLVASLSSSGSVSTTGGGNQPVNINGAVVVGGSFKDSGSWVINHDDVSIIPPTVTTTEDNVVIVAWQ